MLNLNTTIRTYKVSREMEYERQNTYPSKESALMLDLNPAKKDNFVVGKVVNVIQKSKTESFKVEKDEDLVFEKKLSDDFLDYLEDSYYTADFIYPEIVFYDFTKLVDLKEKGYKVEIHDFKDFTLIYVNHKNLNNDDMYSIITKDIKKFEDVLSIDEDIKAPRVKDDKIISFMLTDDGELIHLLDYGYRKLNKYLPKELKENVVRHFDIVDDKKEEKYIIKETNYLNDMVDDTLTYYEDKYGVNIKQRPIRPRRKKKKISIDKIKGKEKHNISRKSIRTDFLDEEWFEEDIE